MKFSINSDFDKLAVKQHIDKLPENKRYTIEITQKRENRTLDQNALYWLWLTCIEQETGNSKEDIHYYCKDNFLPKKEMTDSG
jgi:transposase